MFFKKKKQTVATVDERLKHIAFIMDGNGRWAKKRSMPREFGHVNGAKNFKKVIRYCGDKGVKIITVYAFSTENWKRPKNEVDAIMKLLSDYIDDAVAMVDENNIQLHFLGDMSIFPPETRAKIANAEEVSKDKTLILNIALNYGARAEIAHACEVLINNGKTAVTEEDVSSALYTAHCDDPDLIVRTGGDLRLSNFLLWQAAYAEFYFTDTLWPDLDEREIDKIIDEFYSRKRRYGGL
ncbi:MAG: di-trans,poly-cis-decaprenylcistransferase [Ruminococcaceae bacterium]|nr:di-trans,poly-cis-decaprenylcistransferase [Oscillospiraceae bacterium]